MIEVLNARNSRTSLKKRYNLMFEEKKLLDQHDGYWKEKKEDIERKIFDGKRKRK